MLLRPLGCLVMAVLWPLEIGGVKSKLAASALAVGAALRLWRGVWVLAGETNQQQHNQALHPTARSVVVFPALSLASKLVVTGGRRVSLALCRRNDA